MWRIATIIAPLIACSTFAALHKDGAAVIIASVSSADSILEGRPSIRLSKQATGAAA
jgi:hypothetical protein